MKEIHMDYNIYEDDIKKATQQGYDAALSEISAFFEEGGNHTFWDLESYDQKGLKKLLEKNKNK